IEEQPVLTLSHVTGIIKYGSGYLLTKLKNQKTYSLLEGFITQDDVSNEGRIFKLIDKQLYKICCDGFEYKGSMPIKHWQYSNTDKYKVFTNVYVINSSGFFEGNTDEYDFLIVHNNDIENYLSGSDLDILKFL